MNIFEAFSLYKKYKKAKKEIKKLIDGVPAKEVQEAFNKWVEATLEFVSVVTPLKDIALDIIEYVKKCFSKEKK